MKQITSIAYVCILASVMVACKSKIKQTKDDIYSRHLQRHIALDVVSTPMPDNKEDMNLLIMNSQELFENVAAKKVIDSLYTQKLIQPLVLVAFDGRKENFGFPNSGNDAADVKEYKQFNDFIIGELYPFIKKKVVIRKFHSVATCGFGLSAKNAFYMAFHNDDKIQKAGLFYPVFEAGEIDALSNMRNKATLDLMIVTPEKDSSTTSFTTLYNRKPGISNTFVYDAPAKAGENEMPTPATFGKFLVWAFGK